MPKTQYPIKEGMSSVAKTLLLLLFSALLLRFAASRVTADQADAEPSAAQGAADCIFKTRRMMGVCDDPF